MPRKLSEKDIKNPIARIIFEEMEKRGWTQEILQRKSDVAQSTISRFFKSKDPQIKWSNLKKLLKALELPIVYDGDELLNEILYHFNTLEKEDRITILRFIYRMKYPPSKTSELLRSLLTDHT